MSLFLSSLTRRSYQLIRWASGYCMLFPGQGSQYVGMGKSLLADSGSLPAVSELFRVAENVLGYDLRSLFLNGPQSRLDETVYCQPAVVVASLAALEVLRHKNSMVMSECKAVAGFSVGEITALIAAQSLSLEQGLQVVHVRAAAMQEACTQNPSSMLTVTALEENALKAIIDSVKSCHPETEVCIGNYLFPQGFVVSGNLQQLREVGEKVKDLGAVVKRVKVSGAFHSQLMKPAVPKLEEVLQNVDIGFPAFPVYSNITGLPYKSAADIRTGLVLQVTSPVLWDASMSHMINNHFKEDCKDLKFLEIGPGKQLKGMLKRIDRNAYRKCDSFTV